MKPTRILGLTLGTLTLVSCRESTGPTADRSPPAVALALASNTWVARAKVPEARLEHSAGVVNNSLGQPVLYIFGGNDPVEEFPVLSIQAYNYSTNSWTTQASQLEAFRMNPAGVIGGKVYLSGGLVNTGDGFAALRILNVYDPVHDLLTRKADIPQPSAGGVTGVIGGRLYLLIGSGGDFGTTFSRRFYRYNPATDAWTSLPSCPNVHRDGAGAVVNGKLYVAGGFDANGLSAKHDVFDPATNQWKTVAPVPDARARGAGAALRGKVYLIGGVGSSGLRRVYSYDPATNSWTRKAPLLTGRFGLAASALVTPAGNPKILAVGGFNISNSGAGSANELYTP